MKITDLLKIFAYPLWIFLISEFIVDPYLKYDVYTWIDIPMHFAGGVAMGISAALLLGQFSKEKKYRGGWLVTSLFIIGFVSFAAIVWEWYEFLLKLFFDVNAQPSLQDTMGDFFFGVLGAIAACFFQKKR